MFVLAVGSLEDKLALARNVPKRGPKAATVSVCVVGKIAPLFTNAGSVQLQCPCH